MKSRILVAGIVCCIGASLASCASSSDSGSGKAHLTVACPASVYADAFKKDIIPGFEKKYNVDVSYVAESSGPIVAQLKAQGNNPKYDVVCLSGINQLDAEKSSLLSDIDPSIVTNANAKNLRNYGFQNDDGKAVAWSVFFVGLSYDAAAIKKLGAPVPTSWNDLLNPKYKGQIGLLPWVVYGQMALQMLAIANGGGLNNMDPGFKAMAQISKNGATFIPATDFTQLYSQGDIVAAPWSNSSVLTTVQNTGLPLKFVYPKEGTAVYPLTAAVVKGTSQQKLSQEFVNYMLSPDIQTVVAKDMNVCPIVNGLSLPSALADSVGYSSYGKHKFVTTDFNVWAENSDAWLKLWNAEIQK